jgi:hypothetical protein
MDYTFPKTYYNDFRIGTEFRVHPMLQVRAGYRRLGGTREDPATGYSFGLGTHVGPMNLDYAMTPSNGFSDVHRFSLGYTFAGMEARPEPEPRHPRQRPAKPATKTPPAIATITDTQAAPKAAAPPPVPQPAAKEPAVEAPRKDAPSAASTQVANSANSAPASAAPAVRPPAAPAPAPEATPPAPAPKAPEKEVYEVVLGNYQTEQSAQSELKALQILGFAVKDAIITVVPGKGYRLSLARYENRKPADQFAASLIKMSFMPRVEVTSR